MIARSRFALAALVVLSTGLALAAGDEASGTFTVNGKTTVFKQVYASLEADPDHPSTPYVVAILSDVPIAEADRRPARLLELARAGRIHALRVIWRTSFDSVAAVPYHDGVKAIGHRGRETPTIDIQAFDEKRIEASVVSKMLGQNWQFSARFKAVLQTGRTVELEPEAEAELIAEAPAGGAATGGADPTAKKVALGKFGYAYTGEMFTHAVKDGNLAAVRLFLELGMSPNVKDGAGNHTMIVAAMTCANPPADTRTPIMAALIAAKGDVHAKDENKSEPLMWAAESCEPAMVKALIDAGADVNAKSAGGGTPLVMAVALGRTEVADLLRRAGAKQ